MRAKDLVAICLALSGCSTHVPTTPPPPRGSSLVLRGGTLHTLAPEAPLATFAVAEQGRWVCVGDEARCAARVREGAEVVDLRGATVFPGFADAHGHVAALGFQLEAVDLRGARDEAACVARIADRARSLPVGTWVFASGWNQTLWPSQRFPSTELLSAAVPHHPVVAVRIDGHATWVNAAALAVAEVTGNTRDPAGGRIMRSPDGAPAGVLVDNAQDLLRPSVPPPTDAAIEQALHRALQLLVARGLTSVHDAGVDARTLRVYRKLAEGGELPLHVYAMLDGQAPMKDVREQMDAWRETPDVGRLSVRAVKMYADGALGSRGALLMEPYADDPSTAGLAVTPPEELRARILEVAREGYQPAVHAIGDRAVHEVLDDLLAASRAVRTLRPRVEHLQILAEADLSALVASHAVASMQPTHATSDGPWAEERLGHDTMRQRGSYAWRTVIDAGAPIACGSDFPVEEPDPFAGIRSAVLRTWPGGPPGGWMPEQRMTLDEALACFTKGAAFAEGAEHFRGRIAEGFEADADVVSVDPYAEGVARFTRSALLATIVDGHVAFRRTLDGP